MGESLMRHFMLIIVTVTALYIYSSNTSLAEEITASDTDRGASSATINININPQLKKREDAYKKATEKLSEAEKKELENFDSEITAAHSPEIMLRVNHVIFKACAEMDPEINKTHKELLTAQRLKKQEELYANLGRLNRKKQEMDFIDQQLLGGHHMFLREMQSQFVAGTANIMAAAIKNNSEDMTPCTDLKNELSEEFKEPYFVQANVEQPGFNANNLVGQKMCGIGFKHQAPSGDGISIAMIYFKEGGKYNFDISAKILAPSSKNEMKSLPVENAWVDFGSINSLFWSKKIQPYPSLYIMSFQKDKIVDVLNQMREYPSYISTKNRDWKDQVVFTHQYSVEEVQKMADCVQEVDPELASAFQKVGF